MIHIHYKVAKIRANYHVQYQSLSVTEFRISQVITHRKSSPLIGKLQFVLLWLK